MNDIEKKKKMQRSIELQLVPQVSKMLSGKVLDRFIRVTQTAVLTQPNLLNADKNSLFQACLNAAKDGLEPDGENAVLFAGKNGKVQYWSTAKGLAKLVYNTGDYGSISAELIHESDDFEYFYDENGKHMRFKPDLFGERGKVIGAFASCVEKATGRLEYKVLTLNELQKVKEFALKKMTQEWQRQQSPWNTHEEEMFKKTAIKKLTKYMPKAAEKVEQTPPALPKSVPSERTVSTVAIPHEPNLEKMIEEQPNVNETFKDAVASSSETPSREETEADDFPPPEL